VIGQGSHPVLFKIWNFSTIGKAHEKQRQVLLFTEDVLKEDMRTGGGGKKGCERRSNRGGINSLTRLLRSRGKVVYRANQTLLVGHREKAERKPWKGKLKYQRILPGTQGRKTSWETNHCGKRGSNDSGRSLGRGEGRSGTVLPGEGSIYRKKTTRYEKKRNTARAQMRKRPRAQGQKKAFGTIREGRLFLVQFGWGILLLQEKGGESQRKGFKAAAL